MDRTYDELVELVKMKLPKDLKISEAAIRWICNAFAEIVYEDAIFETEFKYTTINLLFDEGKRKAEENKLN